MLVHLRSYWILLNLQRNDRRFIGKYFMVHCGTDLENRWPSEKGQSFFIEILFFYYSDEQKSGLAGPLVIVT